jgi:hypothetical protein
VRRVGHHRWNTRLDSYCNNISSSRLRILPATCADKCLPHVVVSAKILRRARHPLPHRRSLGGPSSRERSFELTLLVKVDTLPILPRPLLSESIPSLRYDRGSILLSPGRPILPSESIPSLRYDLEGASYSAQVDPSSHLKVSPHSDTTLREHVAHLRQACPCVSSRRAVDPSQRGALTCINENTEIAVGQQRKGSSENVLRSHV